MYALIMPNKLFREFCDIRDGEAEREGAEGVEEDSGESTARDGGDCTTEAMEGASENLNLVAGLGKGVGVFDRTIGEGEDVA